jgi:hypothetical protein
MCSNGVSIVLFSLNIFYLLKYAIWLQDYIDLKLLTSGNPILSNEQNEIIFKHVFEYIEVQDKVSIYKSKKVNQAIV